MYKKIYPRHIKIMSAIIYLFKVISVILPDKFKYLIFVKYYNILSLIFLLHGTINTCKLIYFLKSIFNIFLFDSILIYNFSTFLHNNNKILLCENIICNIPVDLYYPL